MKIYSLVGKSGTGKSFQANDLCKKEGINAIIDDGLFIYKGSVLAGTSAKRQDTTIRAIKTALFKEDDHRDSVVEKINEISPDSILVIGTSDRMIDQITERLNLPKPAVRIDINEITTPEEREISEKYRNDLGQHIIPAPTVEVKKDFSGYFIHPLRMLQEYRENRVLGLDKSVVRPTYSYMGRYIISDKVITDLVELSGGRVSGVDSIPFVYVHKKREGVVIDINVIIQYGKQILEVAGNLQKLAAKEVEEMTSLNILEVNVFIEGLMWAKVKDGK